MVAGLLLTSVILGALVTAPVAERLTGRVDVRWLTVPGFLVVAAGVLWVAHVSPSTGWGFFLVPLAVAGAGIGALEAPAEYAIRRDVPAARADRARRLSYTIYLLSIGLGIAVVSGVWQSAAGQGAAGAVNTALLSCVAAAVLGALISCLLTSDRPAGPRGEQVAGDDRPVSAPVADRR